MVDFTLTDEQKNLRELAHDFAEKEIRPVAWEYDKDGTWPQDIIEKAWEVGLMNTHIPEDYGGPGLDYLYGCLIEEELGVGLLRHPHLADGATAWPPRRSPSAAPRRPRRSISGCSPRSRSSPPSA